MLAALRLAGSVGKRLGRPRPGVNPEQVATLRGAGASWKASLSGTGRWRRHGLFQKSV